MQRNQRPSLPPYNQRNPQKAEDTAFAVVKAFFFMLGLVALGWVLSVI